MRHSFKEKRAWVLARLQAAYEHSKRTHNPPQRPFICAMDVDAQQAWEDAFGGKVVLYMVGPKVSPDFARTLRRMFVEGDLARCTGGNHDARYYCQKTYYVSYTFRRWPPTS